MNQALQKIMNEIVEKIEFKDNSKNSEQSISFEVSDIIENNNNNDEKNKDQSSLTNIIPFEDENSFESDSKDQANYEILWIKRKRELEIQADKNAKKIFKSWKKEKLSLKEIIDISLKDYIELYEHAQALRLQFEAEKNEWIEKARSLLDSYKEGFLNLLI